MTSGVMHKEYLKIDSLAWNIISFDLIEPCLSFPDLILIKKLFILSILSVSFR